LAPYPQTIEFATVRRPEVHRVGPSAIAKVLKIGGALVYRALAK
jgi:hypothetical protein